MPVADKETGITSYTKQSFWLSKANRLIEIYNDLIIKFLIEIPKNERETVFDEIFEKNIDEIRKRDLKL